MTGACSQRDCSWPVLEELAEVGKGAASHIALRRAAETRHLAQQQDHSLQDLHLHGRINGTLGHI